MTNWDWKHWNLIKKISQILFARNLFRRRQIVLKFCKDHGCSIAVLWAKLQNDLTTAIHVVGKQGFKILSLDHEVIGGHRDLGVGHGATPLCKHDSFQLCENPSSVNKGVHADVFHARSVAGELFAPELIISVLFAFK